MKPDSADEALRMRVDGGQEPVTAEPMFALVSFMSRGSDNTREGQSKREKGFATDNTGKRRRVP